MCDGAFSTATSIKSEIVDLPELGEDELSSPHLTLASETVRADKFQPKKKMINTG